MQRPAGSVGCPDCTNGSGHFNLVWILGLFLSCLNATAGAATDFIAFESGVVRPMAMSPMGHHLYSVNPSDNRLEVFELTATGVAHVHDIPVGLEPVAVAVRENGEVWVVNHLSDSVSVLDPEARRVVKTLLVGDAPRDIVFAGDGAGRAFITTAHRGQHRSHASLGGVPGAGSPQLTTRGIGRADVWVFDAGATGRGVGGKPLGIITFFADTPRALAVSKDGQTVYAAAFHSGNRTTTVHESFVCDGFDPVSPCRPVGEFPFLASPGGLPGPAANVDGDRAPEVGLIVRFDPVSGAWRDRLGRDWTNWVRFDLPDHDVVAIDANTLLETASHSGVGTILFNMVVNPVSGTLYVSNTEAFNDVRFEGPGSAGGSTVQGHLHEARITVIEGRAVSPRHLNKHLDYAALAGTSEFDASAGLHSLATPLEMVVSRDGATLYVAAFGSSRVGVLPTAALESDTFDPRALSAQYIEVTGGGPGGLVLDEPRGRLYVWTGLDHGLSVVSLATGRETQHLTVSHPEPPLVTRGRRFLYDARASSANGEASCSSCHVFGDLDSLAWDLGNPNEAVRANPVPIQSGGGEVWVPSPLNGTGRLLDFHPMKGPMTTQTLRGLANHGALHWRGDRSVGAFGVSPTDPGVSFRNFGHAFSDLLGRSSNLSEAEMQIFSEFALSLTPPPNPVRALNNGPSTRERAGRARYSEQIDADRPACVRCHALDPGAGRFGTGGFATFDGQSQIFKVPQLRSAYSKVGMFGFFSNGGGGIAHTGDQVRGFGFGPDGSIDTVDRLLSSPGLGLSDRAARGDVEAYLLAFDSDLAPIVGQQVTLDSTNAVQVGPRIDLFIERANAPVDSAVLGGLVKECDLIAKTADVAGRLHGYRYDPDAVLFLPDNGAAGLSDAQLRRAATERGTPITYTCAPPGAGERMGRNRDRDALLDGVETNTGVWVSATDTGTDPAVADSDGDGFDDGFEVGAGSDPNRRESTPMPVPIFGPDTTGLMIALLAGLGVVLSSRRCSL